MLEGPHTTTIDSPTAPDRVQNTAPDAVQGLRELLVRLQGELKFKQTMYKIEADARALSSQRRLEMRQERSQPLWKQLHLWLQLERTRVPDGSSIAKALDYSLNHWDGLGRFLLDGNVALDNNHCENQMRPWALGRKNWLFIGSQLAGERAAVVMSLLQSAKLNGRDPWAYLKDILTRMPTQLNSRIGELLPHRWQPAG